MQFELEYESLRNRCFKRSNSYEDEIELKIGTKVRIYWTNRLKKEVRNKEDILLNSDTETELLLYWNWTIVNWFKIWRGRYNEWYNDIRKKIKKIKNTKLIYY